MKSIQGIAKNRLAVQLTRNFIISNIWDILTYVLFFGYILAILLTFLDYGITYDEEWYTNYGEYIVEWYLSGFQDDRALTYWTLPLQGGFVSVVDQLFSRISPWGVIETSHLVHGLFGFMGIFGAYKLGRLLQGPQAGFISALFLVLTPRFYGHVFNNTIDITFASLTIIALYILIDSISQLPEVKWKSVIILGIVVGFALAVRTAAVILIAYIVTGYALWLARQYFGRNVRDWSRWREIIIRLAFNFFVICIISYIVMLIFWPAAQVSPILRPKDGLFYTAQFQYVFDVFFEGKILANNALPWYFIPKWFAISLPEFYFISLILGLILIVLSAKKVFSNNKTKLTDATIGVVVLILSVIVPLTFVVITRPANYDGVRHFLFILPSLAVLAGISVARVLQHRPTRFINWIVLTGIIVSLALTSFDLWQLHPYQYIYFNRLFGGSVAKSSQFYETEYWGSSYKEGVEWLVNNIQSSGGQSLPKVASCLYSLSTSYYLPEDKFEFVGTYHDGEHIADDAKPDYFLASPRWNCHENLDGELINTISRQGAPLLYIIKVSDY